MAYSVPKSSCDLTITTPENFAILADQPWCKTGLGSLGGLSKATGPKKFVTYASNDHAASRLVKRIALRL